MHKLKLVALCYDIYLVDPIWSGLSPSLSNLQKCLVNLKSTHCSDCPNSASILYIV